MHRPALGLPFGAGHEQAELAMDPLPATSKKINSDDRKKLQTRTQTPEARQLLQDHRANARLPCNHVPIIMPAKDGMGQQQLSHDKGDVQKKNPAGFFGARRHAKAAAPMQQTHDPTISAMPSFSARSWAARGPPFGVGHEQPKTGIVVPVGQPPLGGTLPAVLPVRSRSHPGGHPPPIQGFIVIMKHVVSTLLPFELEVYYEGFARDPPLGTGHEQPKTGTVVPEMGQSPLVGALSALFPVRFRSHPGGQPHQELLLTESAPTVGNAQGVTKTSLPPVTGPQDHQLRTQTLIHDLDDTWSTRSLSPSQTFFQDLRGRTHVVPSSLPTLLPQTCFDIPSSSPSHPCRKYTSYPAEKSSRSNAQR